MQKAIGSVFVGIMLTIAAVSAADAANLAPRVAVPAPGDQFGIARVLRAAERGDARAQTQLGFMHEYGRGVPQDYVIAAWWYRRAAEQGEPTAQHLLGLLYDKGLGVPVDYIEAHKWLNLAAGRAYASNRDYYIRMRNAIASKMDRPEINAAQRRARYWFPKREW